MSNVVAVDIGTTNVKGVLCSTDGTVLGSVERPNATLSRGPNHFEQDPDRSWWANFQSIAAELLSIDSAPIAVCVTGLGPCVLVANERGEPLRPAILYGIDARASTQIIDENRRFGADLILERCGSPLTSQAVGPKLQWIREREPQVWQNARRLFMANSYVGFRLTGRYYLDHHSASQAVPLYDRARCAWIPEWAEQVAPGLRLPELAWPGDVIGTVSRQAATQTGLPRGIPVVAGTIDAWAEAHSVGVRRPGQCMIMYGTSLFIVAVADSPRPVANLWTTNGIRPGTRTAAAGMSTFGSLSDWLLKLSGQSDFTTLSEKAAELPPGADGLLALPYFAGERTPLFDPDARGLIAGLTLAHGPAHVFRALLEGAALGVRHNLEALAAADVPIEEVVAIGGASRSPLWRQIVSDVTGLTQRLPQVTVGAAYGGAMLAAEAVVETDTSSWTQIAGTASPNADTQCLYDALYHQYRLLYPATVEIVHTLARDASAQQPGRAQHA
jgi:xylulokinase